MTEALNKDISKCDDSPRAAGSSLERKAVPSFVKC